MSFLELRSISKTYGPIRALDGANLSVGKGEIAGLCGQNGAGKSTLVKIMAGGVAPDGGEIVVGGKRLRSLNPEQSSSLGIGVVFQEFELVPSLAVFQNVFLGIERTHGWWPDTAWMRGEAKTILTRMNAPISVDVEVGSLRTGHQQIVEIAKALARGTSILILDEPTAALNAIEKELLFSVLRTLRAEGLAILFISHFINELFEICDRVTVIRDGRTVRSDSTGQLTEAEVIALMLGSRTGLKLEKPAAASANTETAMSLAAADVRGAYEGVTLEVGEGELVGLAGPIGSGCYEVAETLYGLLQPDSGRLSIGGSETPIRGPQHAVRLGVGYVPEDRKAKGLCLNLPAAVNVALPSLSGPDYSRLGFLRFESLSRRFRNLGEQLQLRPLEPWLPAGSFSGGGQQKLLLARWLDRDCRAYVLVEPTRGVDVGAKAEIWEAIAKLATAGAGVLIVSTEADDIVRLCQRCYVMVAGRIVGELASDEVTAANIARLSLTPSGGTPSRREAIE